MTNVVFFPRDDSFANQKGLRDLAQSVVSNNPLMQQCIAGDLRAFQLLLWAYWPFVRGFEQAIDRHQFTRQELVARFGKKRAVDAFRSMAPMLSTLEDQESIALIGGILLQEMRDDEQGHAKQWLRDGLELGIDLNTLREADIPLVSALLTQANTTDHVRFFSMLAATEYIAEMISEHVCASPLARALFVKRNNWGWGVIHTTPHGDHPSHLQMDIDWARAYASEDRASEYIEHLIASGITLFGAAAYDSLAHLHLMPVNEQHSAPVAEMALAVG